MEESRLSQISGEDGGGDDFYEKIEAPKFVDFTVPEQCCPDDRYWFCLRFGCDRKHEEELDPETIEKNFILRVMAARSPNIIRFRKALNRKPPGSSSPKCPLTAPAKSSKPKIARLAVISSISRRLLDTKDKNNPLSKLTATPKANLKKSNATTKALTTPRNRKRISNPDTFKSVRNPKATNIVVPKTRAIAKTLIFHSPKKACRAKISVEFKTPMGKLCTAMSKLDIASGKKQTTGCRPLPVETTSRKLFRGREVKSRVYDSLQSHTQKGREVKPLKNLKRKKKEKDLKESCGPLSHGGDENDSSDMEIDQRPTGASLEECSESGTSKNSETNHHEECLKTVKTSEARSDEHSIEVISETSRGDVSSLSSSEERASGDSDHQHSLDHTQLVQFSNDSSEFAEKARSTEDKRNSPRDVDNEDKENALPSEERASGDSDHQNSLDHTKLVKFSNDSSEFVEKARSTEDKRNSLRDVDNEDKENALPSDNTENEGESIESDEKENSSCNVNREMNNHSKGKNVSNHDSNKANQVTKKTLKMSSVPALGAHEAKYKKPKPTNPKPFRLRTDERSILKEANLEKKQATPLNELTSVKPLGVKLLRKHQTLSQKNKICQDRSESDNVTHADSEKRINKAHGLQLGRTRRTNISTKHEAQGEAVTTPEKSSERTKLRPQGKTVRTTGGLGVIKENSSTILRRKEASKPCKNEASSATEASGPVVPRSVSRGRRPSTIPKEPNFHCLHVPKSCTRKVAA
ncbi:uncharacterized protein LOC133788876 isoform X2 [Humulus lupulus]|uniref:uncharacterized protein LOC133788876 isoform X2 n=1 Tax=Humulus lupulus TaxID=3486 RepID=UPI002B4098DA|nr:uncharacterized protein LOC133788876 isoform X2 [Humulus lupulus]